MLIPLKQGLFVVFHKKVLCRVVLPLVIFTLMVIFSSNYFSIAFNTTSSLDGSVFLIDKTTLPKRGDIAAFRPPSGNLNEGQSGYLSTSPFLKIAMGVANDEVVITDTAVSINGAYLGPIHTETATGKVLVTTKSGLVPSKHYFMGATHAGSYDSRYASIGYIPEGRVIGRAIRLY